MDDKQLYDLKKAMMAMEDMVSEIFDATVTRKKHCPVCKNPIRVYLPYGEQLRRGAQCPVCGSLERHRALWMYFERNPHLFDVKPMRLLHFAPEGVFWNKFSADESIDYYPVDINPNVKGIRDVVDITKIPYGDGYFSMIICNHVLEHIPDEKKALAELSRVLHPDGVAYLNVPIFKSLEVTLEDPRYNTPELRSKFYGQKDHVRKYGKDFASRLGASGFTVSKLSVNKDFDDNELADYALYRDETVFLCKK
ncbi:MAG: class I SAM-dependent methyltransferase [Polyangia bacterium]|jgi:predicted SAM-dependent methyltransferase|nr:class I SAM-dependent methyltransferase [Polyangia bacterium]